jgi:hypothetical protein
MPGQFYDNALQTQHDAAAASLASVATIQTIGGPATRYGRILDVTIDVTTAITVTDVSINVGEAAGDLDAQISAWLEPFTGSAIGDRLYPTRENTAVSLEEGIDINPDVDTLVQVAVAGTAGAGDLRTLVAWW